MAKKKLDREKIINAFLSCALEKSGASLSLSDIAEFLGVNKASLYNHFSSREEIFEAALDASEVTMQNVHFVSNENFENLSFESAIEKIIRSYIRSYELEPIFPMYVFVDSHKFFSAKAFRIIENEIKKIENETVQFIQNNIAEKKFLRKTNLNNLQTKVAFFVRAVFQSLNETIAYRKDAMRRNPESGNGSLFLLPIDDGALDNVIAGAIAIWET